MQFSVQLTVAKDKSNGIESEPTVSGRNSELTHSIEIDFVCYFASSLHILKYLAKN